MEKKGLFMLISKNGREYTITECKNVWKAERIIGGVSVVYEIPKKAAADVAAVERYIEEHSELF